MESTLEALDKWEAEKGDARKLRHRRIDESDPMSPRKELLEAINAKLAEYDHTLLRLREKQVMRRPTKRDQNSLWNLINGSRSLGSGEQSWLRQSEDLVAVAPGAWIDGTLGYLFRLVVPRLSKVSFILHSPWLPGPACLKGLRMDRPFSAQENRESRQVSSHT